jgi:hypothetical protein
MSHSSGWRLPQRRASFSLCRSLPPCWSGSAGSTAPPVSLAFSPRSAGKFTEINGIRVISLDTAVAEGLLFLAPEPRSPHGVDIAPKGDYITVSGKLDPHATVYGFDRILKAIDAKTFEGRDRYGIPILKFDALTDEDLAKTIQIGGALKGGR